MRRFMLLLTAAALVAAGCTGGGAPEEATPTRSPSPSPSVSPTPELSPVALPVGMVAFAAEVPSVPLLHPDEPPYAGPPTPRSLDGVAVAPSVAEVLRDPAVSDALTRNGFVVVPSDLRLFHFAYQGNLYEGWPVFVTTDAAYHVWHLVFDKLLRSLEQDVLLPELERLVDGLLRGARAQTAEVAGTALEGAASRIEQLFQVAAAELGRRTPLGPLARREKALIDAHDRTAASPILGTKIDYSLFTPRGHYTRNADLTRYFVAMSVLGQSAFCLPGTFQCPDLEPARLAILASRVLAGEETLVARWRRIYEPTAFLVGAADDYTPLEVAAAAEEVVGGLEDPMRFADDAAVEAVAGGLAAARPVRIDPERASVRLMGARFVIDSYVLDQLIYPNVGTPEEPRLLPSALDLAAAFGSSFAYRVLEDAGETRYANYDTQLARMREAIAARPERDWAGTVYDAWLHALEPMFVEHGRAYPDFMRTEAWTAKAHQTGLGSYAELKHDTILYTKQAVAEGGDMGEIPERRNWVEPEPAAFGRLAALTELLGSGLGQRDLLTAEARRLLADAADLFRFLERIARDELAGRPISEADNERLTSIGGTLESLWWRTADRGAGGAISADQDAAIVADIASGGNEVLEEATGRIDRIYVLVPDDAGRFQVAVGGVYSYYEFAVPAGTRLTDEAWRTMLDAGEQPERPTWEEVLFPGA
jgi:hypothetical protein